MRLRQLYDLDGEPAAQCRKCSLVKPLSSFYDVSKARKSTSASSKSTECKDCTKARALRYYDSNKAKVSAQGKERRQTAEWDEYQSAYVLQHWPRILYHSAKARCKDKGWDAPSFDEEWIRSQPLVCPYLGHPLAPSERARDPWAPSLDRIDNSKGYTKDNVRVTSWVWNLMRGAMTVEEALHVVEVIRSGPTMPQIVAA